MPCPLNEFSWTCFPRGKNHSSGSQWPCGKDLFFEGSTTSVIRWGSGFDHPHSLPSKWRLIDSVTCKGIFRSFGLQLSRPKEMRHFDVVLWKLPCLSTPFGMFLAQGMSTCFFICRLSFCGRTNHWEISEERFATVSGVFLVLSMLKEVFEVWDQENDTWMFPFFFLLVLIYLLCSPHHI